jgi:taurine dioxygenase
VRPIAGSLGAELSGVDVGALTTDEFAEVHRAFVEYQVIVFRDQTLEPDAFLAFARRWGEIVRYPSMEGLSTHPEILEILKTEQDTYAFGNQWHTNSSFLAIPPKATMLYALELPFTGGDTVFANMYQAYDSLSAEMQRVLSGLRVLNIGDRKVSRVNELHRMTQQDPGKVQVRAAHPVVRTHPESRRKALFVGAHSVEFEGMTAEESAPWSSSSSSMACARSSPAAFAGARGRLASGTTVAASTTRSMITRAAAGGCTASRSPARKPPTEQRERCSRGLGSER